MKRKATRLREVPHRPVSGRSKLLIALAFVLGAFASFMVTNVLAQMNNDAISACVNKVNGGVRVLSTGDSCKNNEYALAWNKQGPQGEPGTSTAGGGGLSTPFFCSTICYLTPLADKFAGKDFSGSQMSLGNFTGANIPGVIFKGGIFISTKFTNANLTGADFSDVKDVPGGDTIRNNKFTGANLTNANFSNSTFQGSDFSGTNVQGANFTNAVLKFDTFSGAQNMGTATITGTTFVGVTCPDGTNSDSNGNTCVGHF